MSISPAPVPLHKFLEKIMQKALTPQHSSVNDCYAGYAVENPKEIEMPLSSVTIGGRPLCNLRFDDDIDLQRGSEK